MKIAQMTHQIDDLKQKAEQGSQQTQGEVQELDLEVRLVDSFPDDKFATIAVGQKGGDIVHHVTGPHGKPAGKILWESKRTKDFHQKWLAKLRDDQRAENAEIAILVTQALPKGVDTFQQIAGVWVVHPRFALPVATALRQTLIDVAAARQAAKGQQSKMALVYEYLTGSNFRHRIEAIVEAYKEMHDEIDSERRALTKLWAQREKQLERLLNATSGMCGDLQGIAGPSLKEIGGLGLKQLAASIDVEGPDPARSGRAVARAKDAGLESPTPAFTVQIKRGVLPRRPVGAKRPPAELVALTQKLGVYIRVNPGNGIEAIGAALDMPTQELALPIRKLIAAKKIRTRGMKRATKYFPT